MMIIYGHVLQTVHTYGFLKLLQYVDNKKLDKYLLQYVVGTQ